MVKACWYSPFEAQDWAILYKISISFRVSSAELESLFSLVLVDKVWFSSLSFSAVTISGILKFFSG